MELYYDIFKSILDELVDNESDYGSSKVNLHEYNLGATTYPSIDLIKFKNKNYTCI
jgi:hypothetical protein